MLAGVGPAGAGWIGPTPERRSVQNAPTAATTNDAVTSDAIWLCRYCTTAQELNT